MILLIRYGSMELRTFWTNLNSIMILLIRLRSETFDASQDNLNSIMILLILNVTEIITGTRMLFKFHYDSINSVTRNECWRAKRKFKFHYDSINSIFVSQHLTIMFHLNSIMILLIQMKKRRKNKCQQQFKFHYDSINSRFKMLSIR